MQKLYIDFDGVILDTIPIIYKRLEKENIDVTEEDALIQFYEHLEWKSLIEEAPQIHHSIRAQTADDIKERHNRIPLSREA